LDVSGVLGLFAGQAPLTVNQQLEKAREVNVENELTVVGHQTTGVHLADFSIPSQFYSPFTVRAIADTYGVTSDQVRHERVTFTPSSSPDQIDTVTVYADVYRGFNGWNLIPGWSLLVCAYFGCGNGEWGLAVLGAIPFTSEETAVARGGLASVRAGQAGEAAVRGAYNISEKTAINIGERTRIPDGLLQDTLSEVKNVNYQAFTQQLRDYVQYTSNGMRFDLYVRPTTILSEPLQEAISSGAINLRFIPTIP
jgi:hypothetical protein